MVGRRGRGVGVGSPKGKKEKNEAIKAAKIVIKKINLVPGLL